MNQTTDTTHENCVLVVDDEEDVRESLRDVIEMLGCSAVVVTSGEEALEVLAKDRPCLVLMDLLMPGMSGAELLAAMRAEPTLADLPVLMSTSAPDRAPRDVPLLPKPIDIDALGRFLKRTCCGHHQTAARA